jgi:hypothetical protein
MSTALGISGSALDSLFTLEPVSSNAPAPFPGPVTFRKALANYMDLDACPSPSALAVFAECVEEPESEAAEKLQNLASNAQDYQQWVATEHPRWRDMWTICPALQGRLPVERLFELCPNTVPRYYCISSSLLATPEEVAVTVGQVSFHLPDGRKRKVCSCKFCCCVVMQGLHPQYLGVMLSARRLVVCRLVNICKKLCDSLTAEMGLEGSGVASLWSVSMAFTQACATHCSLAD